MIPRPVIFISAVSKEQRSGHSKGLLCRTVRHETSVTQVGNDQLSHRMQCGLCEAGAPDRSGDGMLV